MTPGRATRGATFGIPPTKAARSSAPPPAAMGGGRLAATLAKRWLRFGLLVVRSRTCGDACLPSIPSEIAGRNHRGSRETNGCDQMWVRP
jgi:hypothetical protein